MQISSKSKNPSAHRSGILAESRSDEALMHSVTSGDKFALQILYVRHHARLYRFMMRFTRDECLAEDALSEVFLAVWSKAGSFKGECQVATWLLAIARNKILAMLRQRAFAALDEAASVADPEDDPESALDKKDRSNLVQKCLETLSPKHRQIIELVYFQDKSIREAAEIAALPLNTVKTRMFYARSQLGKSLKHLGVEAA